MTDFAKLTGQPAVIDESLETFEVKPEGFENGMGEQLCLIMHPVNGTRFKKAARKAHIKEMRGKAGDDAVSDLTEQELDAELAKAENRSAEILARCCDGWNMTDGKAPMELSFKNAMGLFGAVETLREAVDKAITDAGKKPKATKPA